MTTRFAMIHPVGNSTFSMRTGVPGSRTRSAAGGAMVFPSLVCSRSSSEKGLSDTRSFVVSPKNGPDHSATFDRMRHKVLRTEAIGQAKTELLAVDGASVEARFAEMEKEDEINRILNELKAKRGA